MIELHIAMDLNCSRLMGYFLHYCLIGMMAARKMSSVMEFDKTIKRDSAKQDKDLGIKYHFQQARMCKR